MDLEAIAEAITERTRVLIVNSPHNPTGKIFSATTLERLAAIMRKALGCNARTARKNRN